MLQVNDEATKSIGFYSDITDSKSPILNAWNLELFSDSGIFSYTNEVP